MAKVEAAEAETEAAKAEKAAAEAAVQAALALTKSSQDQLTQAYAEIELLKKQLMESVPKIHTDFC